MAGTQDIPTDPRSSESKNKDMIVRGTYTSTPAGKTTLFIARGIEPVLQYSILAHGLGTSLLHRVGLRTLPQGLPTNTGISLIDGLGLSPYRLVLLSMSAGAAIKHNIWVSLLSRDPMPVGSALLISAFNAVFNTISSYAFLARATSASLESDFPQPALLVGSALYVSGMAIELVSEVQRSSFKSDPKNKGKAYTGGLWQYARHINYGGYTLWRTGYAIAGGGYTLGAITFGFFFYDFTQRAIPVLNEYCEKRYGAAWEKFKQDTPYRLIPYVY